jgi:hypothetical protein
MMYVQQKTPTDWPGFFLFPQAATIDQSRRLDITRKPPLEQAQIQ